ncbi:hypothetical protein MBRA1_000782 [Malassezia brasiliensis]|uniref:ARM repeat-containing protein n=1 Tax=Malassezia brasiliensis TaxID=1821822 RepID=A0AAF0DU61_9BASI|nr:hypothetical protein MBRA1_000782 [Malassezia brasiliensis]
MTSEAVAHIAQTYGVNSHDTSLASTLSALGDALRSGQLRNALGESDLPALCIKSLTDRQASSAALRVLANLCIDHDGNRKRILDAGAVPMVLTILPDPEGHFSDKERQCVQAALGMLLNLQMDFEPAKEVIKTSNAISKLTALSTSPALYRMGGWVDGPPSEHPKTWVTNQCSSAAAAAWGLSLVEDVLEKDAENIEWTRDAIQGLLIQEQSLRAASNKSVAPNVEDVATQLVEHEITILDSIGGLLMHASSSFMSALARPNDAPLRALVDLLTRPPEAPTYWESVLEDKEEAERAFGAYARLRTGAAHVVVGVAADDDNLPSLCPLDGTQLASHWFVEALLQSVGSKDVPLATCALLALGNLARDTHRSKAITEAPHLLTQTAEHLSTNDVKVAHAAVGLLKNLSVSPANKEKVFAAGILPLLPALLVRERDMVQPLQFGVVGLLRQLANATAVPQISLAILGVWPQDSPDVLADLIALRKRSDNISLRMEISRVFVALVRSLWSSHASERNIQLLASNMHADISAVQQALTTGRAKMQTQPILEGLTDLLRYSRKSAVIQSDALLALSLTSSSSKDTG